jgi:hypothetical protein
MKRELMFWFINTEVSITEYGEAGECKGYAWEDVYHPLDSNFYRSDYVDDKRDSSAKC